MKLFLGKKVSVSKEEKALPYFRFFERDMAKIPEEKFALIEKPSTVEGVPFEQRNLFLRGADENFCQLGYGVAKNGTGFVCNEIYMPGVTSDMLDWWFPWHSVGSDLRYKIWDPEDHYFAQADKADYVCDAKIPVNQKTWDVNHYVLEDIGNDPGFLKIQFKRPRDFGLDENLIGGEKCQSLVAGIGDGDCAAAMIHICTLPEGARVPVEVPRGLFAHNIKEFTNLAAILPEVYAENKDNF